MKSKQLFIVDAKSKKEGAALADFISDVAAGKVIKAMVEDVYREANGEIIESPEVKRSISTAAAKLFKAEVTAVRV